MRLTPRQKRILLWLVVGLLVAIMFWAAWNVLLPYVLGLILAYLLLPLVNWLDRHMPRRLKTWNVSRALSILVTYLAVIALLAGVVAFAVPIIVDQVRVLIENWPELTSSVEDLWSEGLGWYRETIPEEWAQTIESNLQDLVNDVIAGVQNAIIATVRTVSGTIGFVIGLVVIPFWLFYILHDEKQVLQGVLHTLPEQARPDVQAVARLIDDVLSAYIRGQLLLVLFVGGMATIAMLIIGVPFALVLGLIAGMFEVLPYIGPILGAIPAVLVALLSDPISAVWVGVAFFAIQQVENLILVPRIAGRSVKLHPAAVMVVLVIGNELAGLFGMLLAVPLAAIFRDVFKYLYLRMLDQPLTPEEAMLRIRAGQEVQLDV
ncbi:MAG: AI-2E family transporter [Chloroflexi bacterium]|nr:MAG: AI-2E family transporter [Chloroflexota bacterium]